ncbi:MAG: phosphotransferase family protein [Oceanospirillaceae bacterium]|nr:phosphotransferase family protein [Oceanospirillaceae bacterium]
MLNAAKKLAENLSCWRESVVAVPLDGGLTNTNFKVHYRNADYVVRIGQDIPEHGIMRFNELNASRAAYRAGISPEITHSEAGAMVIRFIEGETLNAAAVRKPDMLVRILALLKTCHLQVPKHLNAGILSFWVFQVNRHYAATLKQVQSHYCGELTQLMTLNAALETAVGRVNISFCHNDMLAANFIDGGEKLWLIDWDYAGFNSPLFDLANLAANNELSQQQEFWLLESYYEREVSDKLWRSYNAMKCASLLREALWSMVSEHFTELDFDYRAYTAENLRRFYSAHSQFVDIAEA